MAVAQDLRCCHRRGTVHWDGVCWEVAIHPEGVLLAWDPAPPGIARPGDRLGEIGGGRQVLGRDLLVWHTDSVVFGDDGWADIDMLTEPGFTPATECFARRDAD